MPGQIAPARNEFDLLPPFAFDFFQDKLCAVVGDTEVRPRGYLGEVLRSTVHDLRNALAVLNSGARLLRSPGGEERRDMVLRGIEQAVSTAGRLSDNLIDLTSRGRVQSGEFVDVADRLPSLMALCSAELPAGIELTVDLAQDLRRLAMSQVEFDTAILNLVLNARDALPGNGRIVVRARNHRADHVWISVADTGQGMPAEVRSAIGTPGFTTKSGAGHGLGLAQVARLAREGGGRFSIRSAVGRGTVALLDLLACPSRANTHQGALAQGE